MWHLFLTQIKNMKIHLTNNDIDQLERFTKVNLMNSVTGYKSANLLGTKSASGQTNLAVFNSVCHLGSSPSLIHFTLRPHTVARHTYENILETKFFSINQINKSIISQAHHTAASYQRGQSEFAASKLTETYKDDFFAPYVAESALQLGCEYVNTYEIKENGCLLIVAAVKHLYFEEKMQDKDGYLNLEEAETVCINGLDGYALPAPLARFAYAKPNEAVTTKIIK